MASAEPSISLVPQDPGSSLNPVKTIGAQVGEIFAPARPPRPKARDRRQRVLELLANVGLSQPEAARRQYPHELSGGMKQRVLIAIAIALRPALIIADEADQRARRHGAAAHPRPDRRAAPRARHGRPARHA
jgi:ABC-type dipeptide/oligopeptide/nickel transport system ATPase component